MPVVFDASFLIPLLDPKVEGDGKIDVRFDFLFRTLDKARTTIIVPTPALCEVLIGASETAPSPKGKTSPFSRGRDCGCGK